ncbi:MAG: DNA recombination protein RmuC [Parcubacteria group bacterium]|nr:DNA recombination protein RmuC [Parcubacteria group bacterium]
MNFLFLAVILTVIIGGFAALFILLKKAAKKPESGDRALLLLQNQMNEIARTLDVKLGQSSEAMREQMRHQFGESVKIIKDVTERLAKLDETNRQVVSFADQLQNLQDILKNPKQRGILGEYYLETVLKNVLPPGSFKMQYAFKDGAIVDAVIFVRDRIIPVDSKFSLENYNRILEERNEAERAKLETAFRGDLKTRIDETAKYIKPEEGTTDFAFMFIPAEAVYYDLLVNKVGAIKSETRDLIQYAAGEKRVMIVSPTTFLAYLQTVLQGLKALQIEESAKEIRKRVGDLSRHLLNFDSYFQKLGGHLNTSVNMYNNAFREFRQIDKDVLKIGGEAVGISSEEIKKSEENDG